MKTLVFDMDGTIADFYGVDGWLDCLMASDPTPYIVAKPMYNMFTLAIKLNELKNDGYHIIINSWLAKNSTKEFKKAVRKAKREWLDRYNFPYDEIHLIQYGTPKAKCVRKHGKNQILFDDSAEVRNKWNLGPAVDASSVDILDYLTKLYLEG